MLPPVDRDLELNSRAEYYTQYTQEAIIAEKECLAVRNILLRKAMKPEILWQDKTPIKPYVQYVHRGYEQRRWLLSDMKFHKLVHEHDLYYETIVKNQLMEFETIATQYVDKVHRFQKYVQQESHRQGTYAIYDESILLDIIQGKNIHQHSSSSNEGENDSDESYDSDFDSSDEEN